MSRAVNELIDEVADAPSSAVDGVFRAMPDAFFDDMCCVVEYEFFRRYTRSDLPSLTRYSSNPVLTRLARILEGCQNPAYLSLQPVSSDLIAIPSSLGTEPGWIAFKKRAEASAHAAGFSEMVSAGLAGAIHEMADNIIQHSGAERSGVAAFRVAGKNFDYVVADAGDGILESLRRSQEFKRLRDDIEAISLAVLPGVSRFGRESGRGYGFRSVFLPLKDAVGAVRLRSGCAVLNMTGMPVDAYRALQKVIDAWPRLSEPMRDCITAIVKASETL